MKAASDGPTRHARSAAGRAGAPERQHAHAGTGGGAGPQAHSHHLMAVRTQAMRMPPPQRSRSRTKWALWPRSAIPQFERQCRRWRTPRDSGCAYPPPSAARSATSPWLRAACPACARTAWSGATTGRPAASRVASCCRSPGQRPLPADRKGHPTTAAARSWLSSAPGVPPARWPAHAADR